MQIGRIVHNIPISPSRAITIGIIKYRRQKLLREGRVIPLGVIGLKKMNIGDSVTLTPDDGEDFADVYASCLSKLNAFRPCTRQIPRGGSFIIRSTENTIVIWRTA